MCVCVFFFFNYDHCETRQDLANFNLENNITIKIKISIMTTFGEISITFSTFMYTIYCLKSVFVGRGLVVCTVQLPGSY